MLLHRAGTAKTGPSHLVQAVEQICEKRMDLQRHMSCQSQAGAVHGEALDDLPGHIIDVCESQASKRDPQVSTSSTADIPSFNESMAVMKHCTVSAMLRAALAA